MILIVGATGNIGRHVVQELVTKGQSVRIVTRDAKRATELLPAQVEVIQGDLTDPQVASTVTIGIDRIFLATNGNDQVTAELNVIEAARQHGVLHLVKVSVIGASLDNFVVLAQAHAAIEQKLAAYGLPATILRPNWFAENFLGVADTIVGQGAIYGSAGNGKVAFVDSRDTAAVAVKILSEDGHTGKEYQITGPQALTFEEAAERLGQVLGRSVKYIDLPDANFRSALVGAGVPDMLADIYLQINRNAREGNLSQVTDTVNHLTGRPARPLEDFIRDHANAFGGS